MKYGISVQYAQNCENYLYYTRFNIPYMKKLPERIEKALENIRKGSKHYVDIKIINGRTYVYESTSVWDKKSKSIKKITKYIGRITESGEFIASRPRDPQLSAAVVKESSAEIETPKKPEKAAHEVRSEMGKYDAEILTELSADGRITLPQLGKKIGLSPTGTEWQRNNVEKRYGVRYIAEINLDRLGYLTYIIFIKFSEKMPPINEIRRELEKEKSVQLALLAQGEYDIVIYMVLPQRGDTLWEFYNMRSRIFANYDMKLYVAPFYSTYSFIPLRDSFFDMLSEKVWVRNKNQPKPQGEYIMRREYVVLRELNSNGAMDFTKIDSKYNLPEGSARYTYHKLIDDGIIKRITIAMENVHLKYISLIMLQKVNHAKYMKDREIVLRHIIQNDFKRIINKYAIEGDIKVPEGIFFILPVLEDADYESSSDTLGKINGTSMVNMIATSVLVGKLCYRRLDEKLTVQHDILKNEYETVQGAKRREGEFELVQEKQPSFEWQV